MHLHFGHWVHYLIERYGCRALFVILVCCGLGLPLPEDVPLIFAGILVFRGQMNLFAAAACAWCGIIGGDCILYMLGRKYGPDVSKIPIIGRHVDVRRIARVEKWFEQYGVWVVAVGRMFAGIRGVMVVVAGTSKFKFWKFIVADGLAAVVSGGLFMFLGYKFAKNISRLEEVKHHIKAAMAIGLLVLVVGIGGYVWWRNRKKTGRGKEDSADKVSNAPPSGATPSPESV